MAPRIRNTSPSPRRGGATRRGFSKSGRRLSDLAENTKYKINLVVRKAALEIMNGIAEAGPDWSGEFKNSYVCEAVGTGAKEAPSGAYPYSLKNIPQLSTTVKELDRFVKLEISNTAPHASIAMDLEPGIFLSQPGPNGAIVGRGYRPFGPHMRTDLSSVSSSSTKIRGRITAPGDWLPNYLKGGGLQENLSAGVRLGLQSQ